MFNIQLLKNTLGHLEVSSIKKKKKYHSLCPDFLLLKAIGVGGKSFSGFVIIFNIIVVSLSLYST